VLNHWRHTTLIILVCSAGAHAQAQGNLRQRSLFISSDTVVVDTFSIAPQSLILRDNSGNIVSSDDYTVDYVGAKLIAPKLQGQTLSATYRSLKLSLSKVYFNKEQRLLLNADTSLNRPVGAFHVPAGYYSNRSGVLQNTGLEHSGSLMRGLNVSTNSNASLTSEFNLQLSGALTEKVNLLVSISDKNLPALPDGNTASLQEFDRIFMSVYSKNTELQAGDLDLLDANTFFGKYQRKILGIQFITTQKFDDFIFSTSVAAGVAKGKFARQALATIDGNQGPYMLVGNEGEQNIVVISGSERVYIDGKLLLRGADNDYTINYATAEISFTTLQPIVRTSRVVVEFEYTQQSYSRYVAATKNHAQFSRGSIHLNAFYEGDAKNQPVSIDLTDEQKMAMANVGAQTWKAAVPVVDSVAFNGNEVLYAKKDTLVNGQKITIYQYSTNPQEAHFRLRFSFVGQGNGSYEPANTAANGRVYTWVGINMGSYSPTQLLTTPKRKFLFTAGGDSYSKDSSAIILINTALSNNNNNLFSNNAESNKTGFAANVTGRKNLTLNTKNKLSASANLMLYTSGFEAVERFTTPEYERDWDIEGGLLNRDLQQYGVNAGYQFAENFALNINTNVLNVGSTNALFNPTDTSYSPMLAAQFGGDFSGRKNRFLTTGNFSLVQSDQTDREAQFLRGELEVQQGFWQLRTGVRASFEQQEKRSNSLLQATSQAFHQEEIFVQLDSSKYSLTTSARYREDYLPGQNELKIFSQTRELNLTGGLNLKGSNISLSANYKNISYNDSVDSPTQNLLLSKLAFFGNYLSGAISTSATYELGTGMEPRQEFMYVEAGVGQGVYAWRDYNGNGIAEINEFEIAAFRDEASYIRVALPTRSYVQAYTGGFAFQLALHPALYLPHRHWLSRFSNNFSFSNGHKNLNPDFRQNANPFFNHSNSDTSLVNINYSALNTFGFTSRNSKLRLELAWQKNQSKYYLLNGFESRENETVALNVRYNIIGANSVNACIDNGYKQVASQYAQEGKSYNINQQHAKIGGECNPIYSLRLEAAYDFWHKNNAGSTELANLHNVGLTATYNLLQKGFISANGGFVATTYNGEASSAVGYEMLQGFEAGNNFTWGVNFKRTLGYGLEFNLLYSGRKLSVGKVIHSGSMELRLLF
jgi:hypothetical protein